MVCHEAITRCAPRVHPRRKKHAGHALPKRLIRSATDEHYISQKARRDISSTLIGHAPARFVALRSYKQLATVG